MEAKNANPVNVDRGLPSVNDIQGKKGNKLGILVFFLVTIGVIGGAGYWILGKLSGAAQNAAKPNKAKEEQTIVKSRVFEPAQPAPLNKPIGSEDPLFVPAPLPEATQPKGSFMDAPARPAPIGVSRHSEGNPQLLDEIPQERASSPYDSEFTVSGGSLSGEANSAGAEFLTSAQKSREELAAATSIPSQDNSKSALSGMLSPTSTPSVKAGVISDMNLTVAKGTPIECVLSTRIVSSLPGFVKARLTSPLFSANGKVILADRGSELIGEQSGNMEQGQTRLYILWNELRTPEGVTISLNSPATDALGTPGLDGDIDNHWTQRIGAALVFSLIQDVFALEIAKASANGGTATSNTTPAYQSTQQAGEKIAEKILDSTINIPPTLYKNQGDKISVTVARNLDFSSVYALKVK